MNDRESGERWSGISVLPARHDDDVMMNKYTKLYIYIYIYIYRERETEIERNRILDADRKIYDLSIYLSIYLSISL